MSRLWVEILMPEALTTQAKTEPQKLIEMIVPLDNPFPTNQEQLAELRMLAANGSESAIKLLAEFLASQSE